VPYTIHYYSEEVEAKVLALPKTLLARYFSLTDRMIATGTNLGIRENTPGRTPYR